MRFFFHYYFNDGPPQRYRQFRLFRGKQPFRLAIRLKPDGLPAPVRLAHRLFSLLHFADSALIGKP